MNNNEPNKIVNRIYKEFKVMCTIATIAPIATDQYFTRQAELNKQLAAITTCAGAIEVMSKSCLLKLCAMESSWRFVALHSFLIYVSKAIES